MRVKLAGGVGNRAVCRSNAASDMHDPALAADRTSRLGHRPDQRDLVFERAIGEARFARGMNRAAHRRVEQGPEIPAVNRP
jgi:hypothetical protein